MCLKLLTDKSVSFSPTGGNRSEPCYVPILDYDCAACLPFLVW